MGILTLETRNYGWRLGFKIFANFDDFSCMIFLAQTLLLLPEQHFLTKMFKFFSKQYIQ